MAADSLLIDRDKCNSSSHEMQTFDCMLGHKNWM